MKTLTQSLAACPKLYQIEDVPIEEKMIHLHFFIGGCDWYIAEFDGEDLMFGFANLDDLPNAEWGYISLSEIQSSIAEFDKFWTPKPFKEIKAELERTYGGVL